MNNVQNSIMSKNARNPSSVCGDLVAAHHCRLAAAKLPRFKLTTNKKKKKNVNSFPFNTFNLVYLIILL